MVHLGFFSLFGVLFFNCTAVVTKLLMNPVKPAAMDHQKFTSYLSYNCFFSLHLETLRVF